MHERRSPPAGAATLALAGLVCFVAVGAALVSQHAFAMQPCAWCVLQRAIFLCIGIACLIAAACKPGTPRLALEGLGLILALSGVASALWQHFQAAASSSCKLSLADKIIGKWLGLSEMVPSVFEPRASCADAQIELLGIAYDFWSLALFTVLAFWLVNSLRNAPSSK